MANTGGGVVGSSVSGAGGAPSVLVVGARGAATDAGFDVCAGAAAGTGAFAIVSPLACNNNNSDPSETLSPTFTRTSLMVPAAGDGTSIVAFSDSSVTSDSSALTAWPGFTITSM